MAKKEQLQKYRIILTPKGNFFFNGGNKSVLAKNLTLFEAKNDRMATKRVSYLTASRLGSASDDFFTFKKIVKRK